MSDYADIEHDTIADAPDIVGNATEPAPELTDKQVQREEMREALREKRAADKTEPESREAMLARRYGTRTYPAGTEAAQDEWLSLGNDELFTPVRTPR